MKSLPNNPLALTTPGRCRYCHCVDERGCDIEGGCSWADRQHTVCTNPDCLHRWAAALCANVHKWVKAVKAS